MSEGVKRPVGRPNFYESGRMVMRSYRLPEDLVAAALEKAASEKKKLSEVIRDFLEEYIRK